jgi:hypothetical protein
MFKVKIIQGANPFLFRPANGSGDEKLLVLPRHAIVYQTKALFGNTSDSAS